MKNFPHQINQIPRLVKALEVFGNLLRRHQKITDDGIVGDALAQARVYTFRGDGRSIDQRLAKEHRKPRGSQGARTCARDLRRLFTLLGFLQNEAGVFSLSEEARCLIKAQEKPLGIEARMVWSAALHKMELDDTSGVSHPYRILLRLVEEQPGIGGGFLGLCLEAEDDSEEEFERISGLVKQYQDASEMWKSLPVSDHMARNSVKILPALARQLGEITESEGGYYLGQHPIPPLEEEPVQVRRSDARRRRRPYDTSRAGLRRLIQTKEGRGKTVRAYDPDLLAERWAAHEACLSRLSNLVPKIYKQYEGLYDLLVISSGRRGILVEVKTLRDDQARQIRTALGQLLYYEHFDVEPVYKDYELAKLVVTDAEPAADLIALLERHNIGAVWLPAEGGHGASRLGLKVLRSFKISVSE